MEEIVAIGALLDIAADGVSGVGGVIEGLDGFLIKAAHLEEETPEAGTYQVAALAEE